MACPTDPHFLEQRQQPTFVGCILIHIVYMDTQTYTHPRHYSKQASTSEINNCRLNSGIMKVSVFGFMHLRSRLPPSYAPPLAALNSKWFRWKDIWPFVFVQNSSRNNNTIHQQHVRRELHIVCSAVSSTLTHPATLLYCLVAGWME